MAVELIFLTNLPLFTILACTAPTVLYSNCFCIWIYVLHTKYKCHRCCVLVLFYRIENERLFNFFRLRTRFDVNLLAGLPRAKKEHDAFCWTTVTSDHTVDALNIIYCILLCRPCFVLRRTYDFHTRFLSA